MIFLSFYLIFVTQHNSKPTVKKQQHLVTHIYYLEKNTFCGTRRERKKGGGEMIKIL